MPQRMIEVDDGYAVMPRPPRPRPPAQPVPMSPVTPRNPPTDDTPWNPSSQEGKKQNVPPTSTPAPVPPPALSPEYVDDTPDTPRGGRDSVRLQQYRNSPVAFRPFTEIAVAASSGNEVAQSLLQVMQHEPGLYQRFVGSASDRQKALTALFADAGLVEEWDEDVLSILEASNVLLSPNRQISDSVSQQTLDPTPPIAGGDWTVNISLGSNPDAITWALYLLDETFFGRVEPSDFTRNIQLELMSSLYGVELTSSLIDVGPYSGWSPQAVNEVYHGVAATGWALSTSPGETASYTNRSDPGSAFRTAMGPVEIHLSPKGIQEGIDWSAETIPGTRENGESFNRIDVFTSALVNSPNQQNAWWFEYNIVHELGHVFNNRTKGSFANTMHQHDPLDPAQGWDGRYFGEPYLQQAPFFERQSPSNEPNELYADQLLFWVYNSFNSDDGGDLRDSLTDSYIPAFLNAGARRLTPPGVLLNLPHVTGVVNITDLENYGAANVYDSISASEAFTSIEHRNEVTVLGWDRSRKWVAVSYGSSIGWMQANLLVTDNSFRWEVPQSWLDWVGGMDGPEPQTGDLDVSWGRLEIGK